MSHRCWMISFNRHVMGLLLTLVCLLVLSMHVSARTDTYVDTVKITDYQKASFNPLIDKPFVIPVWITDKEQFNNVTIEIRTHDDDLVRTLSLKGIQPKGNIYSVAWDGRDNDKQLVPSEVYSPVLVFKDKKGAETRIDPRSYSGGEEVYDFNKRIASKSIEYTLPVNSRMLVRSGIKNGPMLHTIIDWEPRAVGFHVERWSGRDADDVMTIDQNPQVGYLIVGYQLPDHSIITYGNQKESYRAYRERKRWPIKKANYDGRLLERGAKLIRAEFYTPVLQQKSPRITVNLLDKKNRKVISEIQGFDEVIVEVRLNELDELYLDQERYEISFFVDNQFIAEEEQGFVPFNWRWSPGRYDIKPGDHILTINVSGYNGQVGVKNIPFTLIAEGK